MNSRAFSTFAFVLLMPALLTGQTAAQPPRKLTQLPAHQPMQADGQAVPPAVEGSVDLRPHTFELRFTAKELEGKHLINTREYRTYVSMQGSERGFAQIRSGSRIPISTGTTTDAGGLHNTVTYVDIGINIDISNARVRGEKLLASIKAEVSSSEDTTKADPIIQQRQWNGTVTLTPGKSAAVFYSDELNSKRSIELDVLADEIQ